MAEEKFTYFWGGPFSQWYPCKFTVNFKGTVMEFTSAEQFMMYMKAITFKDEVVAKQIMLTQSPARAKELGRQVRGFDDAKWMEVAEHIVYIGNYNKFTQNQDLLKTLMATEGTVLVEASPRDRRWGIGLSSNDPRAKDRSKWLGQNLLGETLTKLRNDLVILHKKE